MRKLVRRGPAVGAQLFLLASVVPLAQAAWRKHLMSRAARLVVALGAAVFGALILGTCTYRCSSRDALAKFKSELRAKGEQLTWADLGYPRELEPGGSLDRLLAAANPLRNSTLQPGNLKLFAFDGTGAARVAWRMPQPPLNLGWSTNSNALTWEEFRAEFTQAAEDLAAVGEATRHPPAYFYCNPTNWGNRPTSPFVGMRTAAQWLAGDAIAGLHAGQLNRAQADLHALVQLAQFNRHDLTLVSQMIRVAIAGLAMDTTWEALQTEGWTEQSLAALQQDWESLDLAHAIEKGALGERAAGEAIFRHLRTASAREAAQMFGAGGLPGNRWDELVHSWVILPLWKPNSHRDELFFLEHSHQFLEAARKLGKDKPWPEVNLELQTQSAEFDKALRRPFASFRHYVSGKALANGRRAAQTSTRRETQRRLTIAAIAAERYHLRHGNFPLELQALVTVFLSGVPLDPMSGQPLRYRTNATGGFVLYSVGEDGRDDGGDPNPQNATNRFDLWSGKDAVWPVLELQN
jgi:hypothetical protein